MKGSATERDRVSAPPSWPSTASIRIGNRPRGAAPAPFPYFALIQISSGGELAERPRGGQKAPLPRPATNTDDDGNRRPQPRKSEITATPGAVGPSKARSSALAPDRPISRAISGVTSTRPASISPKSEG